MREPIALADYRRDRIKTLRVFRLVAKSHMTPIDIELRTLTEDSNWGLADRFRFWHLLPGPVPPPGLTVRKLDLDEKALVRCRIHVDGALEILSNDEAYAIHFFRSVFREDPQRMSSGRRWTIRSGWTQQRRTVGLFIGHVGGALGWGPKMPPEIQSSLREGFSGLENRNWKSCVTMCRRALQALMEAAHENTFGTKPGSSPTSAVCPSLKDFLAPSPDRGSGKGPSYCSCTLRSNS